MLSRIVATILMLPVTFIMLLLIGLYILIREGVLS